MTTLGAPELGASQTHAHTYMNKHANRHICSNTHTCIHGNMRTYKHAHTGAHAQNTYSYKACPNTHTCKHRLTHLCTNTCSHTQTTCACAHAWTNTLAHKNTGIHMLTRAHVCAHTCQHGPTGTPSLSLLLTGGSSWPAGSVFCSMPPPPLGNCHRSAKTETKCDEVSWISPWSG